jgi:hypothetical protein
MAVYKTISSKVIIRKIFRDLRPGDDSWVDDAIEWIGEALEHIGASTQLEAKQCVLEVKDHKISLPYDLYYINQVSINTSITPATTTQIATIVSDIQELQTSIEAATEAGLDYTDTGNILNQLNSRLVVLQNSYFSDTSALQPLQYGASTFHSSIHCEGCSNENASHEHTYIIDNGYIKTSFESGTLCISYKAFPIDEDCYPLVPDDISYKEAMFWYIYKKLLLSYPKFKNNGINYTFADEQWKYYCTQARNSANYPDIDKYESFMNQWVRLIPNINRHQSLFEDLNYREDLNRE